MTPVNGGGVRQRKARMQEPINYYCQTIAGTSVKHLKRPLQLLYWNWIHFYETDVRFKSVTCKSCDEYVYVIFEETENH